MIWTGIVIEFSTGSKITNRTMLLHVSPVCRSVSAFERILSDEFLPLHLDTVVAPVSVLPTLMAALPGPTFRTVEMAARTLGTY